MWLTILSLLSGIVTFATKVFEYMKELSLINQGRELEKGDLAKQEIEINRAQTEVMNQTVTTEDTIKSMKDGTF